MKRILLTFFVIALMASPVRGAGADSFEGLSGELHVAGGDVGLAAAREAAERIMAAHPRVSITFSLTGAGVGLKWVRMRQADIALYDRDPSLAKAALDVPLEFVPYGVDPVAVVVNPLNPVTSLTAAQASSLFSGATRFWKDAGGPGNGEAVVIPIYIEASEVEGKPGTIRDTLSVSTQAAMRFILLRTREALGVMSVRDLDATVKPVALDGTAATLENFLAGRYNVHRVLHMAAIANRSKLAQAFIDYMTGPEGQAALVRTGYAKLSDKPAAKSALPVAFPERLLGDRR